MTNTNLAVQLIATVLVLLAATISPTTLNVVLIALTIYALLGPTQVIQAIALSVVIKYINPALGAYDWNGALLFWVLLLVAGLRVLPLLRLSHLAPLTAIWSFAATTAVLSWHASPAVAVSLMKIATFAWVVPTVLVAFLAMPATALTAIRRWSLTFALAITVLSALTLLRPDVAYQFVPGSLQGIFSHPQSLGLFLAPASAWVIAGLILVRGGARPRHMLAAGLVTSIMLLSLARTAAVAVAAGVFIACLLQLFARARNGQQAGIGRIAASILIGAMAVAVIGLLTQGLAEFAVDFVAKRNSGDIGTAFYESRGWGIVSQWRNFQDQPLIGHGFGVFADGKFPAGVVEVFGIPISAPVEKGFLPTAILEETGVIGALLFAVVLAILARDANRNTDLRWVAAFWAAICVNLGEAVILSPGGIGLYVWLVIGLCVAGGRRPDAATRAVAAASVPEPSVAMHPNIMR